MTPKSKLEQIRERLSVDNIEFNERTRLFVDLQKAGGKIIDIEKKDSSDFKEFNDIEKATRIYKDKHAILQDIEKSQKLEKIVQTPHNVRAPKQENPFQAKKNIKKIAQQRNAGALTKKIFQDPKSFGVFWVGFNCFIAGITSFFAKRFTRRFINLVSKKTFQSVIFFRSAFSPIFGRKDPESLRFRRKMFEEKTLLAYEMAHHMYFLIDPNIFEDLNAGMRKSVDDAEKTLKDLFRKLYLFNTFSSQLKISGSEIFRKVKKEFPDLSLPSEDLFDKSFQVIWIELYFDLIQLIDYYFTVYNKNNSYKTLEEYLEIDKYPVIGMLADKWKRFHASEEKEKINRSEDPQNLSVAAYPNEYIQQSVEAMLSSVPFQAMFKKFKNDKEMRSQFSYDDKLFYVYVIFDYYDNEYSPLWSGDIVNFYTVAGTGSMGRFDSRKELLDVHRQISNTYEMVNEYLRALSQTSKSDYSQQQMSEQLKKHIGNSSFNTRKYLETSMHKLLFLLDKIIKTKDTDNSVVGNWDEVIVLSKIQQTKKINGKTVLGAFKEVHRFATASVWLLRQSDLSGLPFTIGHPIVLKNLVDSLRQLNDKKN